MKWYLRKFVGEILLGVPGRFVYIEFARKSFDKLLS